MSSALRDPRNLEVGIHYAIAYEEGLIRCLLLTLPDLLPPAALTRGLRLIDWDGHNRAIVTARNF